MPSTFLHHKQFSTHFSKNEKLRKSLKCLARRLLELLNGGAGRVRTDDPQTAILKNMAKFAKFRQFLEGNAEMYEIRMRSHPVFLLN